MARKEKSKPLPRLQAIQEEEEVGIEEIAPRVGKLLEEEEEFTVADLFPRLSQLVEGRGFSE